MCKIKEKFAWGIVVNPFKIKGCRSRKCFESTSVVILSEIDDFLYLSGCESLNDGTMYALNR